MFNDGYALIVTINAMAIRTFFEYFEAQTEPMHSQKKFKPLNPKKEPLTVEKYREFSGDYNSTDEVAQGIVDSILRYARILGQTTLQQMEWKE